MAIGYFEGATYYVGNVDVRDPRVAHDISKIIISCTDGTTIVFKKECEEKGEKEHE